MGLNDLKADSVEVTTKLSVSDIGVILQEICAEWKTTPEAIQSSSGALANFDDRADIEIVIKGKAGLLSLQFYAVQVYVYQLENECGLQLIALGDSGFSKMWYGLNGAIKMSESIKRRDAIVERIMQYSSR